MNSPPSQSTLTHAAATALLVAMTLLAAWSGIGHGPPIWWAGIAAWLAAALLWPNLVRGQRRQATLLAGLGLLAFAATAWRGGQPSWIGLLTQNTALLGLLAAVAFLQLLGSDDDNPSALPRGKSALWRTAFGVHLLGAVINLSAVFIMADRIGPGGKPRLDQAALLTRAFLAAALWSPFFAASAVAVTYAPGANLVWVTAAGLVLAAVLLGLAVRDIARSSGNQGEDFIGYPMHASALAMPGALALLVAIGHGLFPHWGILSIVSLASLAIVCVSRMFRQGPLAGARSIGEHAIRRLPNMAGELALFLAAGTFASGLRSLIDTGGIWLPFSGFGVFEAAIVLAVMILLAALGIHAVISIAMVAAWLAPLNPDPTLLSLIFVQSWAVGLASGPTSGINLAMQGRYGIAATTLSRTNFRYCLQAYAAAVACLAVVSGLRAA